MLPAGVTSGTRYDVWLILQNKKLGIAEKARAIFNYVWVHEIDVLKGTFIFAERENRVYLFDGKEHKLYEISLKSTRFNAFLATRYNLLATEAMTRHVVEALASYGLVNGLKREVRRFSYFNKQTNTAYISRYNGTCWKIDGGGIETVPNGAGVVFADDDGGVHVPDSAIDFGFHGELLPSLVHGVNFRPKTEGGMTAEQQRFALAIWLFALALPDLLPVKPMLLVEGDMGSGKCHPRGTSILMFDGTIKAVEQIVPGDVLMGPDSQPRRVFSTAVGHGPLQRVVPIKGDAWGCNDVHVMTVVTSGHKNKNGKWQHRNEVIDVPISECKPHAQGSYVTGHGAALLFRVPVSFPAKPVDVDPYLVGLWLGDGSCTAPEITKSDPEIVNYCKEIGSRYGVDVVVENDPRYENNLTTKFTTHNCKGQARKGRNVLRTAFAGMINARGEKYIRPEYLINDERTRLELLAGLLDTDGHLATGYYEIVTKFPALAEGILYLARSLGFAAYARPKRATIKKTGFVGNYTRITISGDVDRIPCKVARKKAPPRRQVKNWRRTGFRVEDAGVGDFFGFTLDGDGRYLLGDFTVTHNTLAVQLIQAALHGKVFAHSVGKNDADDFGVQILRSPICLLDNTDNFIDWLQDTLCTYATGGGWKRRKKFTDTDEVEIRPHSFIAIASKNPVTFRRADMTDRTIVLRLARRDTFDASSDLLDTVAANRGRLVGEYLVWLNEIVYAISCGSRAPKGTVYRMADWTNIAFIVGRALGYKEEEVDDMLASTQSEREVLSIENDPLLDLLDKWMENSNNRRRKITSSILFTELANLAKASGRKFYTSPSTLSQRLRDAALEHYFVITKESGPGGVFVYAFERVE